MSNIGPVFSPNELEKFEQIYQAHLRHQEKRIAKLMKELTPLEEDHYDLYLRAHEEATTTNKTVLNQHGQQPRRTTESAAPKPTNNNKKKRDGCNIQ